MRLLVALTEVFRSDGGIPLFNRALLRALSDFCRDAGAEATVLVLNDSPNDLDPRYVSCPPVRFHAYRTRKLPYALRFWAECLRGPDLVILGHVNLLPLALPLALARRRYWLQVHGIEAWRRLPGLSRWLLARARTVLAVSDYTRRRLAEENQLPGNHWRVFPDTLDPFFPLLPETTDEHLTLLSVTRLARSELYKGIEDVLEVLPGLCERFPSLRYVVVGEGDDRPRLERRARELGVADHVTFAGYLPRAELMARYGSCSIFVLPSNKEGFGIVFLEAMSRSKPVVAARAGGIPEVVADGETGLLVPYGDRDALAAALAQLLSDADQRRQMGTRGYRRLQENFTFEHFRRRLLHWLAEELPESHARATGSDFPR